MIRRRVTTLDSLQHVDRAYADVHLVRAELLDGAGCSSATNAWGRLEKRVPRRMHVSEQLVVAAERGRVAAVAAGLQAYPVQRVEVGGLVGPDSDCARIACSSRRIA